MSKKVVIKNDIKMELIHDFIKSGYLNDHIISCFGADLIYYVNTIYSHLIEADIIEEVEDDFDAEYDATKRYVETLHTDIKKTKFSQLKDELDELEKQKAEFWEGHEKRMQELRAASEELDKELGDIYNKI